MSSRPNSTQDREAERQREAVEALNHIASPPLWTVSGPTIATSLDEAQAVPGQAPDLLQQPRRLSNDSDVSDLVLSPRPTQPIPVAGFLTPPARQDLRTPPPSMAATAPPGGLEFSCGSSIPYGLRPTEHDTHHAPHQLDGPRHTSRCGIASNDQFALHCSKYGQWIIDRAPDPHTTIKIGHGGGVAFRFFEAEFLDFTGVKTIKIVHPLCAIQLRGLDWDVVRSVALHLRQYVGRRAFSKSHRTEAVQQAEQLSLRLVEFELQSRAWERKKAADDASGSDAADPASGLADHSPPPHTPLRYQNKSFVSTGSFAPTVATPPRRTDRPDFNTRRSLRFAVTEQTPSERVESNSDRRHPRGFSRSSDTDPYSIYEFHGAYLGDYPVYEQTASSSGSPHRSPTRSRSWSSSSSCSRSPSKSPSRFPPRTPPRYASRSRSRNRTRFEDEADESLGVHYGCNGQGPW